MKNTVFLIIVIFSFVSCSKKEETNIDKYLTHSDKFKKKKVTDPNGNFSLFIPEDWEFESVDYNNSTESKHILAWSYAYPKNAELFNYDEINIIKAKDTLDLKEQYFHYLSKKLDSIDTIIDSGETTFLNYPSYFTHISYKERYGLGGRKKHKIIRFSLKSKQEGVYYYLFMLTLENENQNQNRSMMLHCFKTFEILN